MSNKRTQKRGICIYCGKQQAVTVEGCMVTHGYKLANGTQMGRCSGVGRVHYGHKDAPMEIRTAIQKAQANLESIPLLVDAARKDIEQGVLCGAKRPEMARLKKHLAQLTELERQLPIQLERLEELKNKWVQCAPVVVDLDVEAADKQQARKKESDAKALAAAKEREAQALKAEARNRRSMDKWNEICGENLHQVDLDGEVILQWNARYSDKEELERDHAERTGKYLGEKFSNPQERWDAGQRAIHRVRKIDGRQKQLHRW